jgi:O-antigen/teichoic acid export membrane protein
MSDHRSSFHSSLKWTFLMTWGDRAFGLVFTMLLAAILGPRDFGIVALALIYIALVQLFNEGGVQTAIVQREKLEGEHLDSAFWMNLALCLVLAAVSFLLAGWWADLNGVPELEDVVRVLSVLLVVQGLTIVPLAVFQREMRFKALAIRETAAVIVGGALGLTLALRDAGVWALVAQQLGFAGTQVVLLWTMSAWRPGLNFSRRHARDIVGFSSGVFLANLGGFLNRRADALLMGIFFGPVAVGLYRFADRFMDNLLEVTMRPIGYVSLPFFSRLQNDRPALREAVASCVRTTLILTVPAMAVLAACSDFIMAVMGPEWEPAADVLKLLALVGIGKAVVFFTGPLLFAVARPHLRAVMLWVLAVLSAGIVLLVGWLLTDSSSADQAFGMAVSRAAFFLAIVIPVNIAVVCWITGLRPRRFVRWVWTPLAAAAAGIAPVLLFELTGALDGVRPFVALVVAGGCSTLAAGAVLFALEPRARSLLLPVVRRMTRRGETDAEPAETPASPNQDRMETDQWTTRSPR